MADEHRVSLTRIERESGLVILTMGGELDSYGTQQINHAFSVAVSSDRSLHVLVDLGDINFMSSAGLAMLVVHAQSMARAGGKLYATNANEQVAGVFRLAGFDSLVPLYDSLEEALAEIEAQL